MNNSYWYDHEEQIQWWNSSGGKLRNEKCRFLFRAKIENNRDFCFLIEIVLMKYCSWYQTGRVLLSIKLGKLFPTYLICHRHTKMFLTFLFLLLCFKITKYNQTYLMVGWVGRRIEPNSVWLELELSLAIQIKEVWLYSVTLKHTRRNKNVRNILVCLWRIKLVGKSFPNLIESKTASLKSRTIFHMYNFNFRTK